VTDDRIVDVWISIEDLGRFGSDGIMTGTGIEHRTRGNPTGTCQPEILP
jgi:hypothetical protein